MNHQELKCQFFNLSRKKINGKEISHKKKDFQRSKNWCAFNSLLHISCKFYVNGKIVLGELEKRNSGQCQFDVSTNLELHKTKRHCVLRTLNSKQQYCKFISIFVENIQKNLKIYHGKKYEKEKNRFFPNKSTKIPKQLCQLDKKIQMFGNVYGIGQPVESTRSKRISCFHVGKMTHAFTRNLCVCTSFSVQFIVARFTFSFVLNFTYSIQHLPNKNHTLAVIQEKKKGAKFAEKIYYKENKKSKNKNSTN